MTPELVVTMAFGIAILGFLWHLHRELTAIRGELAGVHRELAGVPGETASLAERLARIEGLLVGFIRR